MRLASRLTVSLAFLPAALGLSTVAAARPAPPDGRAAQARIQEDWRAGRIDLQTRLLEEFRYVFAPERADARYAPESRTLLRCFTPTVAEFERNRDVLGAAAISEIDGYLNPPPPLARATYVSPAGLFEFTYSTSGGDAVSATDVDPANGIPDRVERCAEYADYSWQHEITTLGFVAPTLPVDGTYDMSFESMGAYGYTTVTGGSTTRIVLHNTFNGFPANDDPDGRPLGAAKVTVAHEFKHASQFTTSGWTEGGWVELDATWAEDIVYPVTNDYHNYVNTNGGSVLGQPWTALDAGGSGSYEDCLWQHYLSNEHGDQIIVDLWEIRDASPASNMRSSYQSALQLYGTEWDVAYPKFLEWAWFTGSRSEPPFGFPDAPDLKRMNLRTTAIETYPFSRNDSVDHLAGHPFRFNPGAATGSARILFDGDETIDNWTVSILAEEPDGTFTIVRPTLDANHALDYTVPQAWSELAYVGVIVTNSKRSGGTEDYTLQVLDEAAAVGIEPVAARLDRLTLESGRPNPFRSSTRIAWTVPRATRGSVRLYDVSGRVVRTLFDGELAAGPGEVGWDGKDQAGRFLPAGVYWARLETARESVTRKLTMLR